MGKLKIYLSVLTMLAGTSVFAQEYLSLQQYRIRALEYNQDIQAAAHEVAARKAMKHTAKADFLPRFAADGQASYTGNPQEFSLNLNERVLSRQAKHGKYDLSVGIEQPLYQGGALRAEVKKAESMQKQAESMTEVAIQDVSLEADRRYWNYVAGLELLHVSHEYFLASDSLARTIEDRVREKLTDRGDLLMAQVKRNDAAYRLQEAERNCKAAHDAFTYYIGMGEQDSVVLQTDSVITPLYDLLENSDTEQRILANRPEYAAAQKEMEIRQQQAKINRAQFLPRFSLGAKGQIGSPGYDFDPDTDPNYQVFVRMSIPIYEWGKRKDQRTADHHAVEKARLQAHKVKDDVMLQTRIARNNHDEAVRQVQLIENSLGKAQENRLLALDQYKEGMVSVSDVLDAQIYYLEAQHNYIESKYKAQIARSEYYRACGELTQ